MNRSDILKLLQQHLPTMTREFDVAQLSLFGSIARDQAHDDSDVDVLVVFRGPANSSQYFGLQFYLEDLLKRPVDLVTDRALRPELRPFIERERLHVC